MEAPPYVDGTGPGPDLGTQQVLRRVVGGLVCGLACWRPESAVRPYGTACAAGAEVHCRVGDWVTEPAPLGSVGGSLTGDVRNPCL